MAYALRSLVQIVEQDQHKNHLPLHTRSEINSFIEKARSLRDLVEDTSIEISEDLGSVIRNAAHNAEDHIEFYIVNQLLEPVSLWDDEGEDSELELLDVMEEFDYIKKYIVELKMLNSDKVQADSPLMQTPTDVSSSRVGHPSSNNAPMLGFENEIRRLMKLLSGPMSKLQVIPIVGIGGSGKTTLARHLYEHSSIIRHFDVRVWVTISEDFNLHKTLLDIFSCLRIVPNKMHSTTPDEDLGKHIHMQLVQKRYLIVVDDIWHFDDWDILKRFFPDNHRSRIILTTRDWNLADYAKISVNPYQMLPMDEWISWKLLCREVFGDEYHCPAELIEIGRKISHNCRGSPLELLTIAGRLSTSKKTLDVWQRVESDQLGCTGLRKKADSVNEEMSNQVDLNLMGLKDIFVNDVIQLMSRLMEGKSLQVIPIVGVGESMGKTILARLLYDRVSKNFDAHAWVKIKESGTMVETLQHDLLDSLQKCGLPQVSDDDIFLRQHKTLHKRRYLIVLDGIKDAKTWDTIRRYFKDECKGSRVILTAQEWSSNDGVKPFRLDSYREFHLGKVSELLPRPENLLKFWQLVEINLSTKASNHDLDSTDLKEQVDFIEGEMPKIEVDPCLKGFVEFFVKNSIQLMGQILHGISKLCTIPIVGVAESTGKTILARLIYDRVSAQYFDIHAWVSIIETQTMGRKQGNVLAILQDLLNSLNEHGMPKVNDGEIGIGVLKTLTNRSYLIVLDDVRDVQTWEAISQFFPDEGNGSRIILTAREWSDCDGINPFRLDSFWEFLLGKVATLILTSQKKLEFWNLVEEGYKSSKGPSDHYSNISLIMTFNSLPCHLKPCFLYMGAFSEDCEVKASKIIQLWIAEGFVRSIADNSLEDTATMYLKDLVKRNLFLACKRDCNGEVQAIKVHDLVWRFCQKKGEDERFMCFIDLNCQNIKDGETVRRVSVNPKLVFTNVDIEVISDARSFLCIGPATSGDLAPMFLVLSLLRVLDVIGLQFDQFPQDLLRLINLRYMALTCCSDLPSSISIFRNLQTLITSKVLSLPPEFWCLTQIRHIKCKDTWIGNIPENKENFRHEELMTLMNIIVSEVTETFLGQNPNLRKLGLGFTSSNHVLLHLDQLLHSLEVLKCSSVGSKTKHDFLSNLTFPVSLIKLTLSLCIINYESLRPIGELPSLNYLKLQKCEFVDSEWEPVEGEFVELKSLVIEDLNLEYWECGSKHFPHLQHLVFRDCHSLEEIQFEMDDSPILEVIEVHNCNASLVECVKGIQEEQKSYENHKLRVIITPSNNIPHKLDQLHSPELLKCSSVGSETKYNLLSNLTFPVSLRKLSLSSCMIGPDSMRPVGMLPFLNCLKLRKCKFADSEWEPVEGEFVELKSLLMEDLNLEFWYTCSEHFPRLQHLVIRACRSLEYIQFDLGYFPTLHVIEVHSCSRSLVESIWKIQKEQVSNGNDKLRVISLSNEADPSKDSVRGRNNPK